MKRALNIQIVHIVNTIHFQDHPRMFLEKSFFRVGLPDPFPSPEDRAKVKDERAQFQASNKGVYSRKLRTEHI